MTEITEITTETLLRNAAVSLDGHLNSKTIKVMTDAAVTAKHYVAQDLDRAREAMRQIG